MPGVISKPGNTLIQVSKNGIYRPGATQIGGGLLGGAGGATPANAVTNNGVVVTNNSTPVTNG